MASAAQGTALNTRNFVLRLKEDATLLREEASNIRDSQGTNAAEPYFWTLGFVDKEHQAYLQEAEEWDNAATLWDRVAEAWETEDALD